MLDVLFTRNSESFKAIALYCLPYVAAFSLASQTNLRIWLAAQRAPVPLIDPEKVASQKKRLWIKMLALVSLYLVFLVAVFLKNDYAHETMIAISVLWILSFCVVTISQALADFLRVDKKSIHRNVEGGFVINRIREPGCAKRVAIKTAILLFAGGMLATAIMQKCQALFAFLSVFISFSCVRINRAGEISFKKLFIYLTIILTFEAVIIGFTLYFTGIWQFLELPPRRSPDRTSLAEHPMLNNLLDQFTWMTMPFFSIIPGLVINLVRRFDYQKHVEKSEVPPKIILCTIPPPSPELAEGVIIPSKGPERFKKVYYATGLVTWTILHALFAILSLKMVSFLPENIDQAKIIGSVGFISFAVETPIIMTVMMIVAAIRGDLHSLWNYKEDWTVKKGQGISLL